MKGTFHLIMSKVKDLKVKSHLMWTLDFGPLVLKSEGRNTKGKIRIM